MYEIKTDFGTLHVNGIGRNLWAWSIIAKVTSDKAERTVIDVKGAALTIGAAQAELVWNVSLLELKLQSLGLKSVE